MEFTASADGTKIAFERQGSGEPILLVHGTTASSQAWLPVASHLTDRFTVVAMDRRGHGSSEPGPRHSVDAEAEDVVAVIEAIGEPVHLVGYSFGARASLKAAARSDRLRSLVVYEPPIAVQHNPPDVPDRAEAMIRAGDRDRAAQTFLREAACLPDEEIDEIEAALPDARREFILGQRHMAPSFAPEAFAAVVKSFITDVVGKAAPKT